ncbi:MAG: hypothetical protein R8G66_31785 [Cytophagales bacterium]|nr:hypothetical protein [Cytophagales bacterium]
MAKPRRRYVAKGVSGGWRIWNNKTKKWWGELYERQPDELLEELNGPKRPETLVQLTRKYQLDKR